MPAEPDSHDAAVREQFAIQAGTFTDEGFAARGLDWIVAQLAPAAGEQVLDVCAGAGHLGRALAPHVAHVSAIDLTPEMLAQGHRLAVAAGLRNIVFLAGNATALPWIGCATPATAPPAPCRRSTACSPRPGPPSPRP